MVMRQCGGLGRHRSIWVKVHPRNTPASNVVECTQELLIHLVSGNVPDPQDKHSRLRRLEGHSNFLDVEQPLGAIDLLENPTTGQKVVDYFVFKHSEATAAAELSPVRDFSVADVQLRLDDLRISVNGTVLDASTRVGGSISGAALWFYLPARGRFVMSLLPNPKLGFRRAGEVTNALLSFTDGSDRYDIKSTSRIAPASGRFNLYVLRDPEWRPTEGESNSPLVVGAAARAESLVVK